MTGSFLTNIRRRQCMSIMVLFCPCGFSESVKQGRFIEDNFLKGGHMLSEKRFVGMLWHFLFLDVPIHVFASTHLHLSIQVPPQRDANHCYYRHFGIGNCRALLLVTKKNSQNKYSLCILHTYFLKWAHTRYQHLACSTRCYY